jgi:hypothetical protein
MLALSMVGYILGVPQPQDSLPVPIRTISALGRCIDIDDWFAGHSSYSTELLAGAYGETDRDLLARSGFTSVRILVDPASITVNGTADSVRLKLLPAAIAKFASDELFVVLQLPQMDSTLKTSVYEALNRLRRRDRLVIQEAATADSGYIRNLPGVTMVRTLSTEALSQPPLEKDVNVVYAFSLPGPKLFRDQRFGSGERWPVRLGALTYPPDASRLRRFAAELDGKSKIEVLDYAKSRWSAEERARQMEPFQEWGRRHRRYVWLTDFGCDALADSSSRAEYFRQISSAAGRLRIPWCVGSVSGLYALTRGEASSRSLRSEASALNSGSDR